MGPVRALGALLLGSGLVLGTVTGLWTAWRAVGGEVDYCPDGDCITAYWITLPGLLLAVVLVIAGGVLLRRRQ